MNDYATRAIAYPAIWYHLIGFRALRVLDDRAFALGLGISIYKRHPEEGYELRAFSRAKPTEMVRLRGDGDMEAMLAGVIDDWESEYGWTTEELLAVAVQSGLPVSRG